MPDPGAGFMLHDQSRGRLLGRLHLPPIFAALLVTAVTAAPAAAAQTSTMLTFTALWPRGGR
jgi:hypothetical protein